MFNSFSEHLQEIVFVLIFSLFAGIGAYIRFVFSCLAQKFLVLHNPWNIFLVNILGCFCFGLVLSFSESVIFWKSELKFFILSGFLGSLTTFSSFVSQINIYIEHKKYCTLFLYVGFHLSLGLFAFDRGLNFF